MVRPADYIYFLIKASISFSIDRNLFLLSDPALACLCACMFVGLCTCLFAFPPVTELIYFKLPILLSGLAVYWNMCILNSLDAAKLPLFYHGRQHIFIIYNFKTTQASIVQTWNFWRRPLLFGTTLFQQFFLDPVVCLVGLLWPRLQKFSQVDIRSTHSAVFCFSQSVSERL